MVKVAIAGYFDPIHDGHLDHIEKAKRLGNYLVVIIGTEQQCVAKRGWAWLSLEGKRHLLLAFKGLVDEVVVNIDKDGSCAETLRLVKPDIFAKGGDRIKGNIPPKEVEVCQEIGCRIVYGVGDQLNRSSRLMEELLNVRDIRGSQQ